MRPATVLLPILLLASLLAGCQDEAARIEEHAQRGEEYLEQEAWPEAILEFRNMVKLDPNNAQAHWGLARALLGQKELRRAYWELQETTRLDDTNIEAHVRYGQFLLFGEEEDLDEAVVRADKVLAMEPGNLDAMVLKGRALQALDRDDEALAIFEEAVALAPDKPRPLLLLAEHQRRVGDIEAAEASFRTLVEVEASFLAHAAYAGFLASLGRDRDEEAEAIYRAGLELASEEEKVNAYTVLSNFLASRGRLEETEALLREAIDDVEDEDERLQLIYGLARFYHARGEIERADEMIQEAARSRPDDPEPLLLLSTYRGHNRDFEGALEAAEQAVALAPDDLRARLRKAEVLVDVGYRESDAAMIAQGRAVVDAVLAKDEANPEALFVKAKIDLAEGELDAAQAALRRVLDTRAEWPQAHFLMGSAMFLEGDRNGARSEVARALELDANFTPAARMLTRIHAALGDHELAVETGRGVLERMPGDTETRVVVAQSLVRLRRGEEARRELEKIPQDQRGAEEEFALGRVDALLGDTEGARAHLMKADGLAPHRHGILSALLDLDMKEGRLEESAERILAAKQARPDDAGILQLHGQVSLYTGQTGEAEAAFRRAIDIDPNDLGAYQNLARYLAVTGRPREVLATYERALERNEQAAHLHLIVGSLYELQDRQEEAMERYEDAIRLDPTLAVAKNNLAYLIAERGGNLDRALDLAQEAKSMLPDNPNAADTLGWVLYKKNVPSAAIGYLREAEGGLPTDDPQLGIVRHHLALAYEANGEPERAREVLERALSDLDALFGEEERRPEPPWAADLRSMLARLAPAG